MMATPHVSVIIATRNRALLLQRAIESVRQSGSDVEIIVVDDASTDETESICRRLHGIKYVRLKHRCSLGGARNVGILASQAKYLSFLDDDDVRLPGSLAAQLNLLAADPRAGLIYGQAWHGDADCKPIGTVYPQECPQGDIFAELLRWNFIPCPSVLFRKECLFRVGLLHEEMPGVEDWDLWIRIAELYPVLSMEEPVAVWRQSTPYSGQYTSRARDLLLLCSQLLKERWMNLPRALSLTEKERTAIMEASLSRMSDQLVWEAARALRDRDIGHALKNIGAGLRIKPGATLRKITRASSLKFLIERFSDNFMTNTAIGRKIGYRGTGQGER